MAILGTDDRIKYFPAVKLTGAALEGAIEHAQSAAETAALRPLDLTNFVETIQVPHSRNFYLKHAPLDQSKPIQVTKCQNHLSEFSFAEPTDYAIDPDGLVTVRNRSIVHLRISYWSGLEKSIAAKTAVAAILCYQVLS